MYSLLKFLILIAIAVFGPMIAVVHATGNSPVMLEIIDGDTAFVVDANRNKAWWLVGECRREIPMPKANKTSANGAMLSQKLSDNVTIGRRQVVLEQQFRFNLTATPVSVEVYNSVRGGWSPVPVRENATCSIDAACQRRMELPDC